MTKINDLVTVIIPVYNTGILLQNCIESVIGQTYNNLEIIVVDDGSKDVVTKETLDRYSTRDKRIVVVKNENHGVSFSRNCGIKLANGRYITFVDSDDYINKNHIAILIEQAKLDVADISVVGFENVKSFEQTKVKSDVFSKGNVIYSREQALIALWDGRLTGHVCGKLYKVEVLKNVSFDEEIKQMEDCLFFNKAIYFANRVTCSKVRTYFYYQNEVSATRRFNENALFTIDLCVNRMLDLNLSYGILSRELKAFLLKSELEMVNMFAKNNALSCCVFNEAKNTVARVEKSIIGKPLPLRTRDRYKLLALKCGRIFYILLSKIFS